MNDINTKNANSNDITFHKIFSLIKTGIVRIVIYVLVLAILGGGISAIIVMTKKNTMYQASIEYNYSGIETGLDPLGKNVMNTGEIKSSTLVNATLAEMGFGEEKITDISGKITAALSVNAYIPEKEVIDLSEKTDIVYYPTKFNVTLSQDKNIGFSAEQYITFLNTLMAKYTEYFKDAYNYGKLSALAVDKNSLEESNDYIALIQTYNINLISIENTIATLESNIPDIYNMLEARIQLVRDELNSLENYILSNNVTKSKASTSISDYLNSKKAEYGELEAASKSMADEISEIVSNYKFPTITTTTDAGVVVVKEVYNTTNNYDNFIKKIVTYRSQQNTYASEKSKIDKKLAILSNVACTEEQKTFVENSFDDFYNEVSVTVEGINNELDNYYIRNVGASGVVVAVPAHKYSDVSYTIVLIVTLLCAIVGFIAAMIITDQKIKNPKKTSVITPSVRDKEEV